MSAVRPDLPPEAPGPTGSMPESGSRPVMPGSPEALAAGCRCSVLANAAYRCGAEPSPSIDPTCLVVHPEPT